MFMHYMSKLHSYIFFLLLDFLFTFIFRNSSVVMSKAYCLILNEQFFLAIPWGEQATFYEMNVCFVLNQYNVCLIGSL